MATSSFTLTSSRPLHWISTTFLITAFWGPRLPKSTYLILPTPPWLAYLPFQPALHQVFFTYTFTSSRQTFVMFLDLHTLEDEVSVFFQNIRNWLPSDMASYPRIMKCSTTLLCRFQDFKFKYCNYRAVKISEQVFGRLEENYKLWDIYELIGISVANMCLYCSHSQFISVSILV
jgi:hypothetical protein